MQLKGVSNSCKTIVLANVKIMVILYLCMMTTQIFAQEVISPWDGLSPAAKQRLEVFVSPEKFIQLTIDERASIACVTQHLESKGLLIKIKSISHISKQGGIFARPYVLEDFWQSLIHLGFTSNYHASRKKRPGLREGKSGVGLHIINFKDDNLDIHIDLKNPGSYRNDSIPIFSFLFHAMSHVIIDFFGWQRRDSKSLLRKHKKDHCGLSQHDIQLIEK